MSVKSFLTSLIFYTCVLLQANATTCIKMRIEQTKKSDFFSEPVVSQIEAEVDDAGNVRWATTAPYESLIICCEKNVGRFEKVNDKWREIKLSNPEILSRIISQIAKTALGDFSLYDVVRKGKNIELFPKNALDKKFLNAIYISMGKGNTPTEIKIKYNSQDSLILNILEISSIDSVNTAKPISKK